jgi:hypothetical protein
MVAPDAKVVKGDRMIALSLLKAIALLSSLLRHLVSLLAKRLLKSDRPFVNSQQTQNSIALSVIARSNYQS